MLDRFKLSLLLQGLTLFLSGPACEASSLGLTVHVVPLGSDGGKTVRAHFTAIAPSPCPALSGLCAAGQDCQVHATSLPFTGTKPSSGWCVRQWQKTVPSNYNATISLGSDTEFYVSMNAEPKVRANSGRLNQPAFVALPPPLRARVNCPRHFYLSVKDLDGDKVQCRFARPEQGECVSCTRHSFIELDEEKCMLSFTGKAPAGRYFIYLMAEDLIPAFKIRYVINNTPLSSVPVHLSLTVEESTSSCSDEPVATDETPKEDSVLFSLPYQEMKFQVNYFSQLESVIEVAVVGPPELYRTGFTSVGPLSTMAMAWIRAENKLARLLPICFAANTKNLQSEPRCVWLNQREIMTLPAGTELKCEKTEMTLVLPVASLSNINLAELQLNSPTCPVSYNNTHLTASISLSGCGTKTVHSGSELVYTNTLQSVRPFTMVSRKPSLILPLACRIPGAQVNGSKYEISMPTEEETFGEISVWITFYPPGEGPLGKFTANPTLRSNYIFARRVRRDIESGAGSNIASNSTTTCSSNNTTSTCSSNNTTSSAGSSNNATTSTSGAVGSRLQQLDLYIMSNCSIVQAEMIVSNCMESETEDFTESHLILDQGCMLSNNTFEIVTTQTNSKVYRLDLNALEVNGSTMYVQCTVNLCIATMPSHKCPDLCTRSISGSNVVGSLFTRSYTVRSRAVSLIATNADPASMTITTAALTTTTQATNTAAQSTTTSRAPEHTTYAATGVIFTAVSIFLQSTVLF